MTENAGASGDQTGSPLVADEVTIDVPAGGRVYVVSDLLLRQAPDDAAEAASTEMARSIDAITGPAVLQGPEATILVPPGWNGAVDDTGTVLLGRD